MVASSPTPRPPRRWPSPVTLRLAKHHGLGNDFLVLVDLEDRWPLASHQVRALCDRRRGMGADGLIRVLAGPEGADLTMDLRNGDGGVAEMSGNGIRCLAQAALDASLVPGPDMVVATLAGPRALRVVGTEGPGMLLISVDMGRAEVGAQDVEVGAHGRRWRGRPVDMGNPHLVLVEDDLGSLDLDSLGPALEASREGGVNIEWVRPEPDGHSLRLRVWERGVGATLACGTGSAAAGAAALSMGLVSGPRVRVENPGGALDVDCSGETVVLTGPSRRVGRVEAELWP